MDTPKPNRSVAQKDVRGFAARAAALADRLFGIDVRSLALFRIGLALVLMAELLERVRYLSAFYTDAGLVPRAFLIENIQNPASFSLHLASGSLFFQALLFALALVAAAALLVGYKTQLATSVSWLLLASLFVRNPELQSSGDVLLSLLLFWGMFLPLGLAWSLDRARAVDRAQLPGRVLSMATAAVLLQAAMVYLFAWRLKTGEPWQDGSAVWIALNWDQGTTALGRAMLEFPELLRLATHSVMWFELLGPLLLFLPVFTPLVRLLLVPMFVGLHLSFALMMTLFTFPFVSIVSVVPFLPARFWELLPVGAFTGFRLFGREQSELQGLNAAHRPSSVQGSVQDSGLGTVRGQGVAGRWLQPFMQPRRLHWRTPLALQGVVGLLLVYVVVWNLAGVLTFAAPFQGVARFLQIHQHWAMFAPVPKLDDGWFVVPGVLASGEEVDVFRAVISGSGEEVSWDKPENVSTTFPNVQWRKYLENLVASEDPGRYHHFAVYLYTTWNAGRPPERQLTQLNVVYVLEHTERLAFPPERLQLWEHRFTE